MSNYVLVHGAWHGGWCWRKLVPLLRAAGHEVYTPTLTGLGERAHLLTPNVDALTHIQDVLGVLACEGLQGGILVGHSYAGLLLPAIAERAAEPLAQLVYLDATVAASGQSLFGRYPETRAQLAEAVRTEGDGWRVPPPDTTFGVTDEADVRWLKARLQPQPLAACEQPVYYVHDPRGWMPCTYIACIGDRTPGGPRFPEGEGMAYHELPTGHDAMITSPEALAEVLLRLA